MRLKSSSINSSETSAKYSWPRSEQKEAIQDSGGPEEVDMLTWMRLARWLGGLECCLADLKKQAEGRVDVFNVSRWCVAAPGEEARRKSQCVPIFVVQNLG